MPPENQTIHDFKSASTKVLVHGVPTPSISWLKNEKPIDFNTLNSSQEKTYKTTTSAKSTDQVESLFEINKFRAENAGTVKIIRNNLFLISIRKILFLVYMCSQKRNRRNSSAV